MSTLAIEFRTKPDRVYAKIPRTFSGQAFSGTARFECYPRTGSEQCPGCGADIAEHWMIEIDDPSVKEPEVGDTYTAICWNQESGGPICGHRMTGTVVDMNAPDPRGE